MPVIIDATVSGVNSNSYVTLARSNVLIEQLPHATEWFSDLEINKSTLLVHATRLIDRIFLFMGSKASSTQALEWPRTNVYDDRTGTILSSSLIPPFIEWATVEWAYALYEDANNSTNIAPGLTRLRTPSYEIEMGGSGKRRIPQTITELLASYGDRAATPQIRLIRA